MKVTKRARRDAKQILRTCHVEGRLDEARVRTALAQLVAREPRGYQGILAHLHRLVRLDLARRSARIETAIPLTPEVQKSVAANLTRRHGPGLDTAFAHEPALIGGMRIRVGSDVYDGSVRARLAALADEF
jgi:F-type H+-transporting ATPase subunit delta